MRNRLDSWIAAVSPRWAEKRAQSRLRAHVTREREEGLIMLAAYEAAEKSRTYADWNTRLLSSDQAVMPDQALAISRARDAVRNHWAASSVVDGHVRHIVGIGLTPRANARHPRTNVPLDGFNRAADRIWYQWADDPNLCHTERRWTFTDLQALTVREYVTAGTSFAIQNYTPRAEHVGVHIQIIEFEQMCTWLTKNPDTGFWIRNGVEIDDFGAAVAFWVFTKGHPLEYIQGRMAYTRIPADRVIQSMRPERVRQTQGMGRLAPVLAPMHHEKMLELYTILRARNEAITGASIESTLDSMPDPMPGGLDGASGPGGAGGSGGYANERDIELEPGMVIPLAPGRKMVFHQPTTPGTQYSPFSRTQNTKIAAGAGLDYPTVSRDFSGNTYAGQMQGLLETHAETDPDQQRMVKIFCRPIRRKVITMAVMEGRLEAPGFDNSEWREAYLADEWHGPAKESIDRSKDSAADKINLDYKLDTRRAILNRKNLDVREVTSQSSDENRFALSQDPPVLFPDAQPKPQVSPEEPRPGAQDDRKSKGVHLARNVDELLDRIEKLEQVNVSLLALSSGEQPRVPAGTPEGGQWTSDGGSEGESKEEPTKLGADRDVAIPGENRSLTLHYDMGRIEVGPRAVVAKEGLSVDPLTSQDETLVKKAKRDPKNYVKVGGVIMPRAAGEAVVGMNKEILDLKQKQSANLTTRFPHLNELISGEHAVGQARDRYESASRYGYPQKEAATLRDAEAAYANLANAHPAENAYLRAKSYMHASNYMKVAAGARALKRMEAGEDYQKVLSDMEAEWSRAAEKAVLNG